MHGRHRVCLEGAESEARRLASPGKSSLRTWGWQSSTVQTSSPIITAKVACYTDRCCSCYCCCWLLFAVAVVVCCCWCYSCGWSIFRTNFHGGFLNLTLPFNYKFRWWKIAIKINPAGITREKATVNNLIPRLYLLFRPIDWKDEENPWKRWSDKKINDNA